MAEPKAQPMVVALVEKKAVTWVAKWAVTLVQCLAEMMVEHLVVLMVGTKAGSTAEYLVAWMADGLAVLMDCQMVVQWD